MCSRTMSLKSKNTRRSSSCETKKQATKIERIYIGVVIWLGKISKFIDQVGMMLDINCHYDLY